MAGGRKRAFADPETKAKFLHYLEQGNYRKYAAQAVGINPATVTEECKRNPVFAAEIKAAESKAHAKLVERLYCWSQKQWTAAAWMLERKFPDEWSSEKHRIAKLEKQMKQLLEQQAPAREPEPEPGGEHGDGKTSGDE